MLTYDNAFRSMDAAGNMAGKRLPHPVRLPDYQTHDGKWVKNRVYDSTGAFLLGELERLDMKMHEPLVSVTWGRDIDLREDVTIADEVSSYTVMTFASAGGTGLGNSIGNGKAWIGKNTSQITGIDVDIAKIPHELRPWGMELKYTILELESAAKIGRPIDQQKYQGLQLKHQMDVDEQVYIGDTTTGDWGLINSDNRSGLDQVSAQNLPNGSGGNASWFNKSPAEILSDFNLAINTVWANSAWAVVPTDILLPTDRYGYIATQLISSAGTVSIMKYVEENNLLARTGRGKLNIKELKWCNGGGVGGTTGNTSTNNRMVVYSKDHDRVRFPMTPLSRTPIQYDSIWHKSTYFGRLGVVEIVYPETLGYFDGL